MTKSQLITIVAKKAHLTNKDAKRVVNTLFEEIERNLKKGDKALISGFGTFYTTAVKKKKVYPFGKDKPTIVEPHNVVNFKVGEPLREKVW
jgi:DNA-binding protein HU-beta